MIHDRTPLGACPLCDRPMVAGPSVDRHHLLPKSLGGTETLYLHRICHRKIHATFTERELEKQFHTPAALLANPDIDAFVRWVRKKDPEYYDKSVTARRRGRR